MAIRELKTRKEIIEGLSHIDKSKWIKTLDDLIRDTVDKKEYRLFLNTDTMEVNTTGRVVTCEITCGNQRLIELEQRYYTGKISNRRIACSGKITASEKPEIGMIREMSEELEIDYKFLEGELKAGKIALDYTEDVHTPSTLYPGIMATFTSINYTWEMPMTHYKTTYTEKDAKKISTFGWIPKGTK